VEMPFESRGKILDIGIAREPRHFRYCALSLQQQLPSHLHPGLLAKPEKTAAKQAAKRGFQSINVCTRFPGQLGGCILMLEIRQYELSGGMRIFCRHTG